MKEEDLSAIKRYHIVEYLERKGIKPVRRTPAYIMYRSPLRAETHPSFKVDTEKNLWIDYGEGRGGSIIDLCMRMEGCTLQEAICRLGQTASLDAAYGLQAIGFANQSGGYELRDDNVFKGRIAPKDITSIFTDRAELVCIFEGFMDFLSFLSMKEEVTNHSLVMNSMSNVARTVRYLNDRHLTHIRALLDNDDAGRRAILEFARAGFQVEDMSRYYKDFKDLNDFHVSRVREQREQKWQVKTQMSVTEQNQNKSNIK